MIALGPPCQRAMENVSGREDGEDVVRVLCEVSSRTRAMDLRGRWETIGIRLLGAGNGPDDPDRASVGVVFQATLVAQDRLLVVSSIIHGFIFLCPSLAPTLTSLPLRALVPVSHPNQRTSPSMSVLAPPAPRGMVFSPRRTRRAVLFTIHVSHRLDRELG